MIIFLKPPSSTITGITLCFIGLVLLILLISWSRHKKSSKCNIAVFSTIVAILYAGFCVGSIMFITNNLPIGSDNIVPNHINIKQINLPTKTIPIIGTVVGMVCVGMILFLALRSWYHHARGNQYKKAATILLENIEKKLITHLQCASGQDRTSTVLILAYVKYLEKKLRTDGNFSKKELKILSNKIEKLIVELRHFQFMATVVAPGSEGLQKDSQSKNTFLNDYGHELYDSNAKTNKNPPLDEHDNTPDISEVTNSI